METLVKEQPKRGQLVDIGKGIKAGIINVTPEQAEKMLEHNNHNRGIKKGKISQYAFDMEEGTWQMNGVPLVFNHNGELLDGQNRLHAIIRSGVACEMLVVTGITRQAFQTIDTGANRSGGDVLTTIGVPPGKAQKVAALISRIYRLESGRVGTAWNVKTGDNAGTASERYMRKRKRMTNQMVVEYYQTHKAELDDIYEFCAKHERRVKKVMLFGLFLFVFYNLRKINLLQAEEFCAKLAAGDMLSHEDPIYHLREKLIMLKASDTTPPSWHYPAYIFKAWNMYRKGGKMKRLIIRHNEVEPVIPI